MRNILSAVVESLFLLVFSVGAALLYVLFWLIIRVTTNNEE